MLSSILICFILAPQMNQAGWYLIQVYRFVGCVTTYTGINILLKIKLDNSTQELSMAWPSWSKSYKNYNTMLYKFNTVSISSFTCISIFFCLGVFLIIVIPLALVGHEMTIANYVLHNVLATYHLISNRLLRNNC